MPNGHVNWLRYRAAFGIHSVMLHQEPLEDVKSIQDQAIDAGLEDTHAYETSVMILDTFLSDETDRHVLKRVFRDPAAFPSVQILLADPFGEFARRQHSVVINTLKPVQKTILGLQNIASALGVELPSLSELPPEVTRDRLKPIIQEVKTLCKTHNIELRFFDAFPYGPMYFYRGILVAGRFGVAKDCEELPWYMILDDTRCEHDLFDHSRAEFEVIWNKSEKAFTDAESPVVSAGQSKTHFDVFLICALQEEFDALKNLPGLEWEPEGDIRSDNQEYYKATLMTDSGAKLSLVAAVPSRMGNTGRSLSGVQSNSEIPPRVSSSLSESPRASNRAPATTAIFSLRSKPSIIRRGKWCMMSGAMPNSFPISFPSICPPELSNASGALGRKDWMRYGGDGEAQNRTGLGFTSGPSLQGIWWLRTNPSWMK